MEGPLASSLCSFAASLTKGDCITLKRGVSFGTRNAFLWSRNVRRMSHIVVLVFALSTAGGPEIFAQTKQPDRQPKAERKASTAALTGCLDEQDGRYVLLDD